MPLLVIAGIPGAVIKRNRGYVPQLDNWDVTIIASRDNRNADLMSCWRSVLSRADQSQHGAHIFAYHKREDEYPGFRRNMHDRHRLVWMERRTIGDFGTVKFSDMLRQHIQFESEWRYKLRPQGVDDASLLPEVSFIAKSCENMWTRIRSVRLNRDSLDRIGVLVREFRKTHYRRGYWEDSRGIQFRAASERHGSYGPHGRFKFTYGLPEGFHYNVRNSRAKEGFIVTDFRGRRHKFGKYTNIDCHGSIRGGT